MTMAQVLIRELDEDVVARLKERAQRNGRSLEAELRGILEQAAPADFATARSLAARLRRRLAGRTFTDSAASVADDRSR
jgi:plasmid stability protein